MTTAEPATEVRAMPTYIAIPASKVLGEVVVPVVVSHMVVIRFIFYVVLMVRFMRLLSLIYIAVL